MQRLQDRISQASLGRLQLRMRAVLRAPGAQRQSRQAPGQRDAGGHSAFLRSAGAQSDSRLRDPDQDETPLSAAEVLHASRIGLIRHAS